MRQKAIIKLSILFLLLAVVASLVYIANQSNTPKSTETEEEPAGSNSVSFTVTPEKAK